MASKLNSEALDYFRKHGSRGGKIGAKARMVKLTPEKRSAIAKNAVRVREEKRKSTAHPKLSTSPVEDQSKNQRKS